jgi:hypothetical protein
MWEEAPGYNPGVQFTSAISVQSTINNCMEDAEHQTDKKLNQAAALTPPPSKLADCFKRQVISAAAWVSFLLLVRIEFPPCTCYPIRLQATRLHCACTFNKCPQWFVSLCCVFTVFYLFICH